MTDQNTLANLAAEVKQLRQQVEQANQRLDSIYGAITRLAEKTGPASAAKPSPAPTAPLSASMMMDPGSMLLSLRQHAQNAGLTISPETVDRLQAGLPERE